MHRFVDMSDGDLGLAILNDGIREYEAHPDEDRTLAITLFRGFTATQSPVIDQWDVYPWMKLAQSLGINEWRYAIMPHQGDWQKGNVYREAEQFLLPLESAQAGKGSGDLPKKLSFVEIESHKVILSAMKKHEKRETFVLRLFNPGLEEIKSKVNFHLPVKAAWLTNMNEERKEKLEALNNNSITLRFAKKKIITCEVELAK